MVREPQTGLPTLPAGWTEPSAQAAQAQRQCCQPRAATRGTGRGLDHDYTLFGRVLTGQAVVDGLALGEPTLKADRMIRVRSAVDLASADRPRLEVMDARSREYARWAAGKRRSRGSQLSICDMLPRARSST